MNDHIKLLERIYDEDLYEKMGYIIKELHNLPELIVISDENYHCHKCMLPMIALNMRNIKIKIISTLDDVD